MHASEARDLAARLNAHRRLLDDLDKAIRFIEEVERDSQAKVSLVERRIADASQRAQEAQGRLNMVEGENENAAQKLESTKRLVAREMEKLADFKAQSKQALFDARKQANDQAASLADHREDLKRQCDELQRQIGTLQHQKDDLTSSLSSAKAEISKLLG
jgi:chromosome segregation ATPase